MYRESRRRRPPSQGKSGSKGKIIHVVGASAFGGGSQLILAWAQASLDAGWEVDILTTDSYFATRARLIGAGVVNLDVAHREIRPLRDLRDLVRLYRFFCRSRYDIVHAHTSKGAFLGRAAARLARVPAVVVTAHGFAFHEGSPRLQVAVIVAIERVAARWCDRMTFVSEFHAAWARRLRVGDPDHYVVIPNGIPEGNVAPASRREEVRAALGVPPDDFVILAVARLSKQKGIDDLIGAVPLVAPRLMQNLRVLLAGDGPRRPEIEEAIASTGLADTIQVLGFRTDVADLLATADMVVLPSKREGLSISLLEAMAAAKPIVTTNIGSNLEVTSYGRGALLIPPERREALAEAIIQIATNHNLAERLGGEARRIYLERYTQDRMTAAYLTMYEDLAGGVHRSP